MSYIVKSFGIFQVVKALSPLKYMFVYVSIDPLRHCICLLVFCLMSILQKLLFQLHRIFMVLTMLTSIVCIATIMAKLKGWNADVRIFLMFDPTDIPFSDYNRMALLDVSN